jgi:hypothetical protein
LAAKCRGGSGFGIDAAVSAAGGASVIMDKFDASIALDLLVKHEVTMS